MQSAWHRVLAYSCKWLVHASVCAKEGRWSGAQTTLCCDLRISSDNDQMILFFLAFKLLIKSTWKLSITGLVFRFEHIRDRMHWWFLHCFLPSWPPVGVLGGKETHEPSVYI